MGNSASSSQVLVLTWRHEQLPPTASTSSETVDPIWHALDEALSIGGGESYRRGFTTVLHELQLRQLFLEERDAFFRLRPQMSGRWGTFHRALANTILVFRSDLRLNTDGPTMPVLRMLAQIIAERRPRLVVSVGLGGGVRPEHQIGDVVVTTQAQFELSGELAGYEENGRTFGGGSVVEEWFAGLAFSELREPALLGSSPNFATPPGGWPQPQPHRPQVRVNAERPVLTRPALNANTFRSAPSRAAPRNPYLGDRAAAVDMDAAAAAKACQDAGVPFLAVIGLTVPALEIFEYDWDQSLRDGWAEVFSRDFADAAAANVAATVRRICERA